MKVLRSRLSEAGVKRGFLNDVVLLTTKSLNDLASHLENWSALKSQHPDSQAGGQRGIRTLGTD